jgi:hypothetical protein
VRVINRVLAALLSLALMVVGVLLIVEVIADRVSTRPAIVHWHAAYAWATRTTWSAGSIRVTCALLIVAGLLLLAAELRRARVARLRAEPARSGAAGIDTAYTRRGVAAAVRSAVTRVDGVGAAVVKVGRRKIKIAARATARDKTASRGLQEPVSAAAAARIQALGLRRAPSVRVRVYARSR